MNREKLLRPWVWVWVKMPDSGRRFVGEIVSMPTLEKTIMVRQVPTVAATAIELPTDCIEDFATGWSFLHFAEISGEGSVPLDALIRDNAVPFNFSLNESTHMATLDPGLPQGTQLVVAAVAPYRHVPAFKPLRWQSHGWTCKPFDVQRLNRDSNAPVIQA